MNRPKAPLFLALALLLAGAAVLATRILPERGNDPRGKPPAHAEPSTASSEAARTRAPLAPDPEDGEAMRPGTDMAASLRSRYAARIHEPHTQMRMLEQLMRHFQQLYPTGWEEPLLALVKQAFPELYEELALRLRQRVAYAQWMESHREELRAKPVAERRAAVWEERNQLFGEETARKIWAAELRNESVGNTLSIIDALPQADVNERLARYKQSLEQTFGDEAPGYMQANQQELMNRFLDLGSVQRDLGAMTPEQRAEHLRAIREGMGLDEAALERWKDLDTRRDARWALGEQYMAERAILAQQHTGPELERRLSELRARYFADEAQTIAEEEASGFYRFGQPRQWGRN
ncbi:hypothetical protein [Melittangium boletus]|uniref:Lipase modulator n=1 Tax=Melittangium boletus DSM 14713 TaxID=1294270 RepID=A0A250IEL3_9BACT|nr:hypothetical protein [Melittangium boletus]ATB29683.1 hypothetical protein MEBOL_003138 [Melittangium boletus DSM 14713]